MNEHELQYSAPLQGSNVWRFRRCSDDRLIDMECTVRFGPAGSPVHWVAFRAYILNRNTPQDRMMPAMIFVSEGVWRTEPCRADFQRVPKGTSFLFKGAPPELTP